MFIYLRRNTHLAAFSPPHSQSDAVSNLDSSTCWKKKRALFKARFVRIMGSISPWRTIIKETSVETFLFLYTQRHAFLLLVFVSVLDHSPLPHGEKQNSGGFCTGLCVMVVQVMENSHVETHWTEHGCLFKHKLYTKTSFTLKVFLQYFPSKIQTFFFNPRQLCDFSSSCCVFFRAVSISCSFPDRDPSRSHTRTIHNCQQQWYDCVPLTLTHFC